MKRIIFAKPTEIDVYYGWFDGDDSWKEFIESVGFDPKADCDTVTLTVTECETNED